MNFGGWERQKHSEHKILFSSLSLIITPQYYIPQWPPVFSTRAHLTWQNACLGRGIHCKWPSGPLHTRPPWTMKNRHYSLLKEGQLASNQQLSTSVCPSDFSSLIQEVVHSREPERALPENLKGKIQQKQTFEILHIKTTSTKLKVTKQN